MPDDNVASFPLADLLGLHVSVPEPGRAVGRLTVIDTHLNPNGAVHGAVLFAMVDTAMGAAVMSVLDTGLLCASTDVHLRFLRPVTTGIVEASVCIKHRGRSMITLDGDLRTSGGKLVAAATGNFAVLAPQ